jgi:hypothetical protein
MHNHRTSVSKSAAKLVNAPLGNGKGLATAKPKPAAWNTPPEKFTYALAAYTVERHEKGWFIAKTSTTFAGERPNWLGPFVTIETACLSIGRHLATEIADRHTRSIEFHGIGRSDALYGLKPTTRLRAI